MLGLLYIALILILGDAVARRFFSYYSTQQRLATGFLIGMLFSSIFTYLFALVFSASSQPLLWANLSFIALAAAVLFLLRKYRSPGIQPGDGALSAIWRWLNARSGTRSSGSEIVWNSASRPSGSSAWDAVFLALLLIPSVWLIFLTLSSSDGSFLMSIKGWSDFGANISLTQSFALGNNFPTTHPFYPDEPIRYHFLFWFLSANLSYLGLSTVWAVNLLSILSVISLLVLIMSFVETLFGSRIAGRIASVTFFLASSSLSFIPFLAAQPSLADAFGAMLRSTDFLNSGYDFRGETWGALTVNVYATQRHLISGVGLFLIVCIYLVNFYKQYFRAPQQPQPEPASGSTAAEVASAGDEIAELDTGIEEESSLVDTDEEVSGAEPEEDLSADEEIAPPPAAVSHPTKADIASLVFCGALIGLLPYWNSAVFVSAAIVIGGLLLFMPKRSYLLMLIAASVVIGLPQVLMIRAGTVVDPGSSLLYFGYTVANPTIPLVFEYIGWTFGFKLVLVAIALYFSSNIGRRFFLAATMLLVIAFTFKLSTDIFNNHKLLNLWNVFASVYAAYAVWMIAKNGVKQAVVAALLFIAMVLSAVIDLSPVRNDRWVSVPHHNDPLTKWVLENTAPKDIFLSDLYLSHPIVFSGRKTFLGNTLFAWTAGYPLARKEAVYRELFQEKDPKELAIRLNENNIAYVAIDDGVRQNKSILNLNESTFESNFEKVFTDPERRYGNIVIYRVPRDPSASGRTDGPDSTGDSRKSGGSAFVGGAGVGNGQFKGPRGIAVAPSGQFYVADAGNSRVQVFSDTGEFRSLLTGFEFGEPNGIAIDQSGNIFVTDAAKHKLLKFSPAGVFQAEWPDAAKTTFYGPRGVAIGPNGLVYVVDQGNSRVVAVDPTSERLIDWGKNGSGEGEFAEPGGIEIFDNKVFVIDTLNNRIQSFSLEGTFIASWAIPEWDAFPWQFPDIKADAALKRFYVTSPRRNEILVLGTNGQRLGPLSPPAPNPLQDPAFIAVDRSAGRNRLLIVNHGGANVSYIELGNAQPEAKTATPGKK